MKFFNKSQTNSSSVLYDGNQSRHSQSRTIADLQRELNVEIVTEIGFINPKLSREKSLKEKSDSLVNGLVSIQGKFPNLTSLTISGYDLSATNSQQDALNSLIKFINQSPNLKNLTITNNNLGLNEIAVIKDWVFGEQRSNPISMAKRGVPSSVERLDISGNNIGEASLLDLQNLKEKIPNLSMIVYENGGELEVLSQKERLPSLPPKPKTRSEILFKKIDEALEGGEVAETNFAQQSELLEEIDRALASNPGEYIPGSNTTLRGSANKFQKENENKTK
jgi:hypothetical protein